MVEKLGKVFLMISSPNDGDKLAVVHALNRALEKNGVDYHTLVARMAKPWLSNSAKEQFRSEIASARAAGRVEALREIEAQRGGGDFRSTDGSDDWKKIALYVQREKDRLPARVRTAQTLEFIDDMAMRAQSPFSREPTQKQGAWLYDLFSKLGGRIT